MLLSGGELVLSETTPSYAQTSYYPASSLNLTSTSASYSSIYRNQLWVFVVVSKRARATARLPLKVYKRSPAGRSDARDSSYARLLAKPNPVHDPFFFWLWTSSTVDVYGEALWYKLRGRNGGVSELWPWHPAQVNVRRIRNDATGLTETFYAPAHLPDVLIPERDIVHFRSYNPDTIFRGMSPLEPLRQTLVNEDAARRATSSFWANGARPGMVLQHPGELSVPGAQRLKLQWDQLKGGADNTGSTVVLEEGMKAEKITLTAEEAQYIETRKLNREEVCAAYDVPPPVVHILDRATFSNITEQMRSMYRDTMAPHLGSLEATLDAQLRPEFGDDNLYAEFLMDEVLRGAFEDRAQSMQAAINAGLLTPNEGRTFDNRPALEGGDRLYINSTMVPLDTGDANKMTARQLAEAIQKIYLGVGEVITPEEAREILNREGAGLVGPAPGSEPPVRPLSTEQVRSVLGRLGRYKSIEEVDGERLTLGLNGESVAVLDALALADDIDGLRSTIKAMALGEAPVDHYLEVRRDEAKALMLLATKTQEPTNITVNTPDVHVDARTTVEPPPPAVTNVDARTTVEPSPVNVTTPRAPLATTKTIKRNAAGDIVSIHEEPSNG